MIDLLAAPTVTYCENASLGLIKRPWFFISNLAFFISGGLILVKGKGSRLSRIFGLMAIMVGFFSAFYDASFTRWSQIIDLSGMFIFASVILFISLGKIFRGQSRSIWLFLVLLFSFSFVTMILAGAVSGDIIFGTYVLGILATEGWLFLHNKDINYKYFLQGIALLAIGFEFWLTDITKVLCFKIGLFNGRSVFHYLVAASIYLVYCFYASQEAELKLE